MHCMQKLQDVSQVVKAKCLRKEMGLRQVSLCLRKARQQGAVAVGRCSWPTMSFSKGSRQLQLTNVLQSGAWQQAMLSTQRDASSTCLSRGCLLQLPGCSLPLRYSNLVGRTAIYSSPFNALQVEQLSEKAAQQASELQAAEGRVQQLTEQDEAKSRELQAARDQLQAVVAEERQLQEKVAGLGEDLAQLRWGTRA